MFGNMGTNNSRQMRAIVLIIGLVDSMVKLLKGQLKRTNTKHGLGMVTIFHPFDTFTASTSLDSFIQVFNVDSIVIVAMLETRRRRPTSCSLIPKLV